MGKVSIAIFLTFSLLVSNILIGCAGTPEETASRHVDQAINLTKQGRYHETITECNKAIEADSNCAEP